MGSNLENNVTPSGITSLLSRNTVDAAVEYAFVEIIKILNTTEKEIIWIDNIETVPFDTLAERLTEQQMERIQYVRVFTLDGILEQLYEVESNSLLVIINLNDMFQQLKSQSHHRSHYLLDQILKRARELCLDDVFLLDVLDDLETRFLDYYIDGKYTIIGGKLTGFG